MSESVQNSTSERVAKVAGLELVTLMNDAAHALAKATPGSVLVGALSRAATALREANKTDEWHAAKVESERRTEMKPLYSIPLGTHIDMGLGYTIRVEPADEMVMYDDKGKWARGFNIQERDLLTKGYLAGRRDGAMQVPSLSNALHPAPEAAGSTTAEPGSAAVGTSVANPREGAPDPCLYPDTGRCVFQCQREARGEPVCVFNAPIQESAHNHSEVVSLLENIRSAALSGDSERVGHIAGFAFHALGLLRKATPVEGVCMPEASLPKGWAIPRGWEIAEDKGDHVTLRRVS